MTGNPRYNLRDDSGRGTVGGIVTVLVAGLLIWVVFLGGSVGSFFTTIKENIPGLGPERSTESYCKTFVREGTSLHDKWKSDTQADPDNPFGQMATVFGSIGDLADFFDKLAATAPDEIQSDVKRQADAYRSLADTYGHSTSLSDIAFQAMAQNLLNYNSERRVDQYTTANCPAPIGTNNSVPWANDDEFKNAH